MYREVGTDSFRNGLSIHNDWRNNLITFCVQSCGWEIAEIYLLFEQSQNEYNGSQLSEKSTIIFNQN